MSTTAIFGFGRFGRALGELVLDAGGAVRAWDPHADVPDSQRAASPAALVAGAQVVVIATPVAAVREAVTTLRPHLSPSQLVIDVSSVKHDPVAALSDGLGAAIPWCSTHPLFGPTSIALGERPLLAVVCPNDQHPDAASRARRFYESIGCEVIEQDAEAHDRLMAHTHAMAFFLAKGLMDIGAGEGAAFVPPSFRALARTIDAVRSDASHLFTTIQTGNPFAAGERTRLLEALRSIDRDLAAGVVSDAAPAARLAIPDMGEKAPDLRETRELIDDLDHEMVQLLARRAQLARRAGRAKASAGKPVLDAERERQVVEARRNWARSEGIDPEGITEIFESIMRFSRAIQRSQDA